MKPLTMLAWAACFTAPVAPAAQPAGWMALHCDAGTIAADPVEPNLHGTWDFLMVPGGVPSFGLMSIGFAGTDYGGSLMPARTAPVVLRKVILSGHRIQMIVATREADVVFDGRLSAKGDFMCGNITYHRGEVFPMVAQKRPSTYQPQAQPPRTP